MNLKPYPSYKDSGVEWIGEIPEGWEVHRLKHVSNVNISNIDKKSRLEEPKVRLCNYTDVYYNEFITEEIDFMEATCSTAKKSKLLLKKGVNYTYIVENV